MFWVYATAASSILERSVTPVILLLDLDASPDLAAVVEPILSEWYGVVHGEAPFRNEDTCLRATACNAEAIVLICRRPPGHEEVRATLDWLQRHCAAVPLMLVTRELDPQHISAWLASGIADFAGSPINPNELLARLGRLLGNPENKAMYRIKCRVGLRSLIGESREFNELAQRIQVLANSSATALIEGETGTGKEVCARAVHYLSGRGRGPFVALNCGAIPVELMENELFGHEREAYTGATCARSGLVREAHRGTLFLDEVDSLAPASQVKLLRLLQTHEYRPLGSGKLCTDDVRIIAATNSSLEQAVRTGKLRQDLFYRLNVLYMCIPPLRERVDDILPLARHFVARYAAKYRVPVPVIPSAAAQALLQHTWPGNVRELESAMERAVLEGGGRAVLRLADMRLPGTTGTQLQPFQEAKAAAVAHFEQAYIERLLMAYDGNISHAARAAGKHRRAFFELIRKHRIDPRRFRHEVPA